MDKLMIIKEMVCKDRDIMPHTLNGKTRKREVVLARQLCYYFARNYTKLSLSQIGNEIGQKDHATVIHGCRAINNLIDTDKAFASDVSYIKDLIQDIIDERKCEVTLVIHLLPDQWNGINYQYHINNELRFSDIPVVQIQFNEVYEANRALKMDEVSYYEIQVKVLTNEKKFKPENKMEEATV